MSLPSSSRSDDFRRSVRTIRARMKLLEDQGLVRRQRRFDNSTIYIVAVGKIRQAAAEQRAIWQKQKMEEKVADDAFEQLVKENKTLASPTDVAEDATFAPPSAQSQVKYVEAVTQWIMSCPELTDKIDAEQAHSLASGVCREYPGSAPAIAIAQLSEDKIQKVAAANNPAGYLRTILTRKIEELLAEPYERDQAKIDEFVSEYYGEPYGEPITQHPRLVDDRIAAILNRASGDLTLNQPFWHKDNDGDTMLVFPLLSEAHKAEDPDEALASA